MKHTGKVIIWRRNKNLNLKIHSWFHKFMMKVKKGHKWIIKAQLGKFNNFHLFRPMKCSENSTKTAHQQSRPQIMILHPQMLKDSLWMRETKRIAWTYLSTSHHQNSMISVRILLKFKWITSRRHATFWTRKYLSLHRTFLRRIWTKATLKMKTFRIHCKGSRTDWSIF